MSDSKHDIIANRLASNEGASYNEGQGPDIKTSRRVIEVAVSPGDIDESKQQLQDFRQPRYIATTSDLVPKALEQTEGTSIGVMGPTGHIHKRASSAKRPGK